MGFAELIATSLIRISALNSKSRHYLTLPNCGAASVGVLQDNLVLSTELTGKAREVKKIDNFEDL